MKKCILCNLYHGLKKWSTKFDVLVTVKVLICEWVTFHSWASVKIMQSWGQQQFTVSEINKLNWCNARREHYRLFVTQFDFGNLVVSFIHVSVRRPFACTQVRSLRAMQFVWWVDDATSLTWSRLHLQASCRKSLCLTRCAPRYARCRNIMLYII